ncbi:hypothetical protein ACSBR1_021460 [Camellia fascicularis]
MTTTAIDITIANQQPFSSYLAARSHHQSTTPRCPYCKFQSPTSIFSCHYISILNNTSRSGSPIRSPPIIHDFLEHRILNVSCVPLYNFSYIYRYLMASPKSFVDSFLDKKEGCATAILYNRCSIPACE